MRQEGSGVVAALEEMLTVARALQTPVEISHLKAIGKVNWRAAVPQMLAMMESARGDGVDVACDVYPYTAGSTQLIHVLSLIHISISPRKMLPTSCSRRSLRSMPTATAATPA